MVFSVMKHRSRVPPFLEFRHAQFNIAEDAVERADLECRIAVNRHEGLLLVACHDVMAAANANDDEPETL